MSSGVGSLLEHGVDILSTALDSATNRILAYLGDVKAQIGDSDRAKWVQHVGFASRPGLPTAKKAAAQAVIVRRSDGDVVIGSSDARTLEMYGALDHGETALFAGGSDGTAQGRILLKGDSSVTIYTQNGPSGTSVAIQAKADGTIRLFGPLGAITIDSGGMTMLAGQSGIKLGADGSVVINCNSFVVNGNNLALNGGTVFLGATALPTPANAALHGPAGLAGIASTSVFIGL